MSTVAAWLRRSVWAGDDTEYPLLPKYRSAWAVKVELMPHRAKTVGTSVGVMGREEGVCI